EAGEANCRGCRPEIDSDDPGTPLIEMKKLRSSAARRTAARTLGHPALFDKLLGDCGDSASLEAGMACKVGARDWLVSANEVKDDAPVDVACRLARGNLEIGEVDLSHSAQHIIRGSNYITPEEDLPRDWDILRGLS